MRTQVEMAQHLLDCRARLAEEAADSPDSSRRAALAGMVEALAWALRLHGDDHLLELHEADQDTLVGGVTLEALARRDFYLLHFPAALNPQGQNQQPWSAIIPRSHARQLVSAAEALALVEGWTSCAPAIVPTTPTLAGVVVSDPADLPTTPLVVHAGCHGE